MQHLSVLTSEWKQRDMERELLLQRQVNNFIYLLSVFFSIISIVSLLKDLNEFETKILLTKY